MARRLLKMKGTRQIADTTGIEGIRSVAECSVACNVNAEVQCVGFNFKRGPPIMCEICRVPHDAPTTDMSTEASWNHYAVIPWI